MRRTSKFHTGYIQTRYFLTFLLGRRLQLEAVLHLATGDKCLVGIHLHFFCLFCPKGVQSLALGYNYMLLSVHSRVYMHIIPNPLGECIVRAVIVYIGAVCP